MSVIENISVIRSTLPRGVELVAVSKFHPVEKLREAFTAGQRVFGESRVQELAAKVAELGSAGLTNKEFTDSANISGRSEQWRWHFIGHLQTNKVRQLLRLRPALIESVDSLRLLEALDAEAAAQEIVQPVLMQLHVAREETKTGFLPEELLEYFDNKGYESLRALHICGVMGMASNTDDTERVRADFREIRSVFDAICSRHPDLRGFDTVSMGMSHDYPIAIEEGATLVRVGSAIFGNREY